MNVTLTKGQNKGQIGINLSNYEALYNIYNQRIHYSLQKIKYQLVSIIHPLNLHF